MNKAELKKMLVEAGLEVVDDKVKRSDLVAIATDDWFSKYKALWIKVNTVIEDRPAAEQKRFSLFENPLNDRDNLIDYEGEYEDLNKFFKASNLHND